MNIKTVENMLCTKFEIHSLGSVSHYLGMEVLRIDNNFKLRQNNIIEKLWTKNSKISNYPLDPSYGKSDSTLLVNNDQYQRLIGSLLYLSVNTRPDISASGFMDVEWIYL